MITLIIEVQFTAPGGEHLARHLQERCELTVLDELADLSDGEREGIRVTSRIVDDDGYEL
jgi:hypothetical protein